MLVSDLLEGKGFAVATIGSEATVGSAVADLVRHRVGALVVSPDGRHIEGIVSERDIVAAERAPRRTARAAGVVDHVDIGAGVLTDGRCRVDHEPDDRAEDPSCSGGRGRRTRAAS